MKPDLYIFAKRPDMGQSKTRLAADIGPVHAQRLYRAMTARIIRQVNDPRWNTTLYVSPAKALGQVPAWDGLPQRAQPSGSLSPRLAEVFSGPRRPVIVIGSDCPQVTTSDIVDALKALRSAPFVFGPANDGGFWLMAANAPLPSKVFDQVRWSSEHTLSDLRARLGGEIALLRTLTDVDDAEGLRAWKLR